MVLLHAKYFKLHSQREKGTPTGPVIFIPLTEEDECPHGLRQNALEAITNFYVFILTL